MNRELKFKLIRQFPWAFKKELKVLSEEYKEIYKDINGDVKDSGYEYTLMDIVASVFDEQFLDKLRKHYAIFFKYDDKTPDALKYNPKYLDYIAKNNPAFIHNFPNEMITDEHVRLYEEYLKGKYSYISSEEIPFRLTDSKFIIDKYLEHIEEETLLKEVLLAALINSCRDKKEKIEYIINKLGDRFYNELFNNKVYENLRPELKNDEELINHIIEQSIFNYDIVPKEKRAYARKIIIDKIERDEIENLHIGEYHYNKEIYKDKEIFYALLKKEMSKHTTEEVDMEYLRNHDFYNYKISTLLQLFLTNFNPDIENLSIEDQYNLYKIFKINKDKYNNYFVNSLYQNKNLLKFMIDRHEDIDFHDFSSIELDDDSVLKIFNYSIDSIKDIDITVAFKNATVFLNTFKNRDALNKVLNKILSLDKIGLIQNISPYITSFEKETFDNENLKLLFQVFEKFSGMRDIFVSKYSSDPYMLKKFIELNREDLTANFNEDAYDNDNIILILKSSNIHNLLKNVTDHNKIESAVDNLKQEEVESVLENAINKQNILVLLSLYRNRNLGRYDSPKFEEYKDKFNEIINSTNIPKEVIEKILSGERKAINAEYITNDSLIYFFTNFGDICSKYESEELSSYSVSLLEKINKKQFVSILKDIEKLNNPTNPTITALNMYLALGFDKCKEILNPNENKNYGYVSANRLLNIFGKLNTKETTFKKDGNSYVPIIEESLINTIFGKNYKVRNTPFRNYINDYEDSKEVLDSQIKRIEMDLTLTPEQKEAKIKELNEKHEKYKTEVQNFIKNLDVIFYNWDVIEEEFLKKQNKSKLDLKLNIAVINEIANKLKSKVNIPTLEVRDEPLKKTDIFDYVGLDTQYTHNASEAPKRAITLSRMMETNKSKKFPHIDFSRGEYKLETFAPSDREILTAGYKSKCCFRPNGNADNHGSNSSLLTYCCTNEYGGGLKIVDSKGKYKMFTPILRNGNVLMLHSIETAGMSEEESIEIHEMLKEYAKRVLEIAKEKGDKIDFVTITNLHYLNNNYVIGELMNDKRFRIYDKDHRYKDMYNNLEKSHMILAKSEGATPEDVRYDYEIDISYESPKKDIIININIDENDEKSFNKLDLLKELYTALTQKKQELLKRGNKEEAYEVVEKMKVVREKYLSELKSLSKKNEGLDKYSTFNKVKPHIESIAKANDTLVPQDIRKVIMGVDWYIVVDKGGTIIGDTLNKENKEYDRFFKIITDSLPNSKAFKAGIKAPSIEVSQDSFEVPQNVADLDEGRARH